MFNALVYVGGLLQVAALLYFVTCMLCFLFGGWHMVNGGSDKVYNLSVKMFRAVGFLRLCKAVESQERRIERGLEVTALAVNQLVKWALWSLFIALIALEIILVISGLSHLSLTNALLIGLIITMSLK